MKLSQCDLVFETEFQNKTAYKEIATRSDYSRILVDNHDRDYLIATQSEDRLMYVISDMKKSGLLVITYKQKYSEFFIFFEFLEKIFS